MRTIKSILSLVVLMGLLPATGRADTSGQDVIAKVIHAYGGKDTVEKIHSVCAKGKIVAYAFNAEGTYSYCIAKDRKLRVDIDYTTFAEHRVLNGKKAMVRPGDGSSSVLSSGPNYLSVVYQYMQLSLPRSLLAGTDFIHYQGREMLHGQPVDILSLEAGTSLLIKIYVNAVKGRIVKTSGSFRMGGAQIVLSSIFYDFRKVDNTFLPFKCINYAGGDKIAETTIQGYELNPLLSDQTFQISADAAN